MTDIMPKLYCANHLISIHFMVLCFSLAVACPEGNSALISTKLISEWLQGHWMVLSKDDSKAMKDDISDYQTRSI